MIKLFNKIKLNFDDINMSCDFLLFFIINFILKHLLDSCQCNLNLLVSTSYYVTDEINKVAKVTKLGQQACLVSSFNAHCMS